MGYGLGMGKRGLRLRGNTIAVAVACALAVQWVGCGKQAREGGGSVPDRVVSLAPSVTETLFALGCSDRVVGVTDYCSYLSQARGLPTVGGYVDPNYEQMLRLRPDLVILMQEHEAVAGFLDKADIAYMTIDNHDIAGVMRSIRSIGAACGARERADSVVRSIETALAREPVSGDRPSVLLCVGRKDMGGGTVSRVVAAGPRTFYHELIDAAGGRNVVEDSAQVYPMFSVEGVMRLAPEVIIDVGPTMSGEDAERARRDWRTLDMIPAVRTGNVHCLVGTHVTIPGPRIPLLMHDLREVIAAAADRYGDTMPQRSHHPGGVDSLGREGGGGAACS